ncbi:MAG: hypothetical protein Q8J78_06315 [Moraxellaceae bacterium]|nr:hypothetical protein [Moraxellaceae bacterium]
MAKAASPIRLHENLMAHAAASAQVQHRSTAAQIEYWAELGRHVSARLSPEEVLAVFAGLMKVRVEPVASLPVPTDTVLAALEQDRATGALVSAVTGSAVRYRASLRHPGLLDELGPEGRVRVGRFQGGVFTPVEG